MQQQLFGAQQSAKDLRTIKHYVNAFSLLLNYSPWVNNTADVLSSDALSQAAIDVHMTDGGGGTDAK